jgi:hypothetical protein
VKHSRSSEKSVLQKKKNAFIQSIKILVALKGQLKAKQQSNKMKISLSAGAK